MSPPKKTPWHEKGSVRMALWLVIAATTCGAFYMFSNLATKNIAARSNTQAPPASTASAAPATP